ncbi:hypothetical protein PoB_007571200 [Plakobranchus ocellatus]|uniref:Secreted protein n=1 Tax=Plakobranchus ocellatus TaxID=259542 RepID=A0AAV4DYV0_9GAST|nr:hypothetical protein PoB_007571200 [Plakobranchus ocellatus]
MSGLNAVFLITSGCLSHSGRSAETTQSSQPSNRPFLWVFIGIDPPCHFFTPPSVMNTVELVKGVDFPFSCAYDRGKFLKYSVMPPRVSPL